MYSRHSVFHGFWIFGALTHRLCALRLQDSMKTMLVECQNSWILGPGLCKLAVKCQLRSSLTSLDLSFKTSTKYGDSNTLWLTSEEAEPFGYWWLLSGMVWVWSGDSEWSRDFLREVIFPLVWECLECLLEKQNFSKKYLRGRRPHPLR